MPQIVQTWKPVGDQWFIIGKECRINLMPRPAYCDRGDWLATIEAYGELARSLDEADFWPRYYFDIDRAKLEVEAWLFKRKQAI